MEALLVVLAIAVIIGGIVWLAIWQQRQATANLTALATRLGLQIVTANKLLGLTEQHLEGTWQGRRVRIWTYSTGSGKSRRQWVSAGVLTPQGGDVAFALCAQGVLTKISEFFGTKEIQVGDARFDAEWFVTTNRPMEFAAALLPDIREKLLAVRAAGAKGTFQRTEGWVCYVEQGSFASAPAVARLEAVLPVLLDLADVAEVCAPQARA